jgi:hypothetical protein
LRNGADGARRATWFAAHARTVVANRRRRAIAGLKRS